MHRLFGFTGALALSLAAVPALALAAPPSGATRAHLPAPVPHTAPPRSHTGMGDIGIPARFDGQMKPLSMPQHFAPPASADFKPLPASPLRRYALLSAPGSLWYPALLTPECAAANAASPSKQQPSGFTLGSLVDGKSDLLSTKKKDGAAFAGANAPAASNPNGVTLQISAYQPGCGVPAFTRF
jgi:hypothetical protein